MKHDEKHQEKAEAEFPEMPEDGYSGDTAAADPPPEVPPVIPTE